MKVEQLVGTRFKERPADCVVESHALMIRGGYIKSVGNGIYSEMPIMKNITRKIENIIRDEMNGIDGQEVLFPVVLPADLWEESGRFESVGSELVRLKDRNGSKLVLGMTHEEAAVHLVREYAQSYNNYPFMIYQIQRKFRDEARPRAGMIRVREFTMKDAYSFHTSQEDLETYYKKCFDAYNRIFKRAGIPEVISVASDSGMMGGSVSHEYMLLTPAGEDSIVICDSCGYRSNMEAADCIIENEPGETVELQLVETPECKTIEAVCEFLKSDVKGSCKAVVYQKNSNGEYVIAFIRGDLEINETKLRNLVGEDIYAAEIRPESGIVAGYIGPYQLTDNCTYYIDQSLKGINNITAGANKEGYHYVGLNFERDLENAEYYDFAKAVEGGICPVCKKHSITIKRGIEVGNIFQLGTKYTEAMGMQYTDENGNQQYPIMGCYGIGVGRLAASVCEVRHDDYGPIWPITIAPYEVHVCALRADDEEIRSFADDVYDRLKKDKIEVIYDDRKVRPGAMFSDADLIGAPVRVVISPKNMKEGVVEITTRDKSISKKVAKENAVDEIESIVKELYDAINN